MRRVAIHRIKKLIPTVILAGGVLVVGGEAAIAMASAIEYALGLGIGMADLPFEAIEWYSAFHA